MLDVIKTMYALKNGVDKRSVYNWRAPVFLFSNENVAGYLDKMNKLTGKKVLAVAGSGDHAFECLLRGAKQVDVFDVNYLQKHIVELKAKMIKHLPYSEFMRFFFSKSHFFDRDIIKPIWHKFSYGLRVFLNKYYKSETESLFRYRTAQSIFYSTDKISYLKNEEEYKRLGRLMPDKINFKRTDIKGITTKFETVYDTILLSNISEYMFDEINDTTEKVLTFYDKVLCPIADKNLNENGGQICFGYTWRADYVGYAKMIKAIQRQMKYSIDDFDTKQRRIDMVSVPTVYNDATGGRPDVALTMTQRVR